MYSSIKLTPDISKFYKTDTKNDEISNLSKINIFIGPNNSGKSRFLRGLFIDGNSLFRIIDLDLKDLQIALQYFLKNVKENYPSLTLESIGVDAKIFSLDPDLYLSKKSDLSEIYTALVKYSNLPTRIASGTIGIGSYSMSDINQTIITHANNCLSAISKYNLSSFDISKFDRKNIYIPILRGLRGISYEKRSAIELNNIDGYKQRTITDYFKNTKEIEQNIQTGLNLYEDAKRLLLGITTDRQKIKDFEKFLSETFFENQEINIIPLIDDDVVHVKIGDDEDRPIYNLGEGIQSIIILTYPLFVHRGKNINFFFEEPDLYLHPGFQRIFIETLNNPIFSSFQYFFTTHSNHFLDMTLDFSDTSVFSFQRRSKDEFKITNVKNSDKDILQAIGARNSSVFLTNCTIWVEGITDRIYIRKYLELFMTEQKKKYKEDIHFSFVEYGGNNITHWSFLEEEDDNFPNIEVEPLCGKLFLISDSDNTSMNKNGAKSKKLIRQEKLNEYLKENFYCLEAKEIENTLEPKTIISVIKQFENNNSLEPDFFKALITSKYKNKPLGEYIDKSVPGLSRKYSAESGTVANKVQFAKYAVSNLHSIDDISPEAKNLAKKLYDFISKNNP